ncbi:hypothetical protein WJX72_008438 [[Myrmecia] bisecta]|uniref:Uncharacterized protein n=1 Tax=[Myrmecia] bisecta TaxID=41462 RepID=A0AAW1QSW1_9CHLO
MTPHFLWAIFKKLTWLKEWEGAHDAHIAALHYQLADQVTKEHMLAAHPCLGPRKGAAGIHVPASIEFKVPVVALAPLDSADGRYATLDFEGPGEQLHLAGYSFNLGLQLANEAGSWVVQLLMGAGIVMPMEVPDIWASEAAPLVYSGGYAVQKGQDTKCFTFSERVCDFAYQCDGDFNVPVTPDEDGHLPVTQALQDAGYIKNGFLELGLRATVPLSHSADDDEDSSEDVIPLARRGR